ncbi:MAG: DUF3619 family protein [Formivibrio sp.]|nr:DUF3619 family protein [Formivibrio sp.]
MNEREFAQRVTRTLNRATVSPKVADRLRSAREMAVAHASTQGSGWTSNGNVLVRFWHRHHAACIGLLLVLTLSVAGSGWQWHQAREADRALEAQILADELPMDVLLSGRF